MLEEFSMTMNLRQPTRILYVLYSSRSCGASLFRGSCDVMSGCQLAAGRYTYEFDRDLGVVQEIGALEDDTEGSLSNLLADSVMYTDDVRG